MKLPGKWQNVVGEKMVNTLFNKVLGENEKCVFYSYFKAKGTFWPTQCRQLAGRGGSEFHVWVWISFEVGVQEPFQEHCACGTF